jgi:hypothetical protein
MIRPVRGVMFNLLERFVLDSWGADAYEGILERCEDGARGPFISVLEYPDAAFFDQMGATAAQLGTSLERAVEGFGVWAVPHLAKRYPSLVEGRLGAHACILALPEAFHDEVRKLDPDVGPPPMRCEGQAPNLTVTFVATPGCCALLTGLLRGVAHRFGEHADVHHCACVNDGASACRLKISLHPAREGAA